MAAKQNKRSKVTDDDGKVPESAKTNAERRGDDPRTPTVAEPENRSFNERTSSTQPFILDDGTQDNGARDLENQDGSSGESSREGNQSVREDTKDAIADGVIPASDEPDVDEKPVKNPVK